MPRPNAAKFEALVFLERLKQVDFARFIQRQGNNYASANQIAAEGKAHWTNCLHSSLLRDKCSPQTMAVMHIRQFAIKRDKVVIPQ